LFKSEAKQSNVRSRQWVFSHLAVESAQPSFISLAYAGTMQHDKHTKACAAEHAFCYWYCGLCRLHTHYQFRGIATSSTKNAWNDSLDSLDRMIALIGSGS